MTVAKCMEQESLGDAGEHLQQPLEEPREKHSSKGSGHSKDNSQ